MDENTEYIVGQAFDAFSRCVAYRACCATPKGAGTTNQMNLPALHSSMKKTPASRLVIVSFDHLADLEAQSQTQAQPWCIAKRGGSMPELMLSEPIHLELSGTHSILRAR
jgi:hypothetical protein